METSLKIPRESAGRVELWVEILSEARPTTVVEIGVWKGDFAAAILRACPSIDNYIMIDPWAPLPDWNKPFNVAKVEFEEVYAEAMQKTQFAAQKLKVLRGTTKEMARLIADESVDFAYIDGDHTLRGITIDLIMIERKIKRMGVIGGDDFALAPWEHGTAYEPTLVCPFAVYFAEAMNLPITALPHRQFLIEKGGRDFRFDDATGKYRDLSLSGKRPSGSLLHRAKRTINKFVR